MDVEIVRRDFPIYSSRRGDIVYFDNACQTFRPRQVIEAMNDYYFDFPACGGRSIHRLATQVSIKIDEAREKIARFIGCSNPNEIVFTKNCTEGLNLVAKGMKYRKGDVVLTTDMEHNSNHVPWIQLTKSVGIKREYVKTPPNGLFDLEAFKKAMSKDVKIVSLVHTNNVTGTTIPAKEVVEIAHDRGALVMLDGAQAAPHIKIDVKKLDVDFYAFSMHKMLGPSGVGVLYAEEEVGKDVEPLITGGGGVNLTEYDSATYLPAPDRFEAGLMNYSGVIGSGAAIDYLTTLGMDEIRDHDAALNSYVTAGLTEIDLINILEPVDPRKRGSIVPFNVKGLGSHDIAMILDEVDKIMIRSGMHCTHPFFTSRGIDGCARASFYIYNTISECERFVKAVRGLVDTFSM
ncbi:MAG: cysteine desulfurase [Methanomassiliicoccales archaeon]|nr:cysteine desulfurase [Methanomassiliicoccales archaeon]